MHTLSELLTPSLSPSPLWGSTLGPRPPPERSDPQGPPLSDVPLAPPSHTVLCISFCLLPPLNANTGGPWRRPVHTVV